MDINKNQQINTFTKGMDTDTSDMYLGSDQYRMAENVRLITDTDSNSGELHLIEGTNLYDIEFFKVTEDSSIKLNNVWENAQILATDSIRNIGVLLTKALNGWNLYKINFNEGKGYLLFGPCTEPIWTDNWNGEKEISTVLRWESDTNIKLYMADSTEKHQLMIIPLADNLYMGDDFNDMFPTQYTLLLPPTVEISNQSGTLKSGILMYAYRLYTEAGDYTSISPLSRQLATYKTVYSGYLANASTEKAIDIRINDVNYQQFQYIQVYRILYSTSGEIPEIQLIVDQPIDQRAFSYTDSGGDAIKTDITYEEFLGFQKTKIVPKHIESKEDYLFGANVKYKQDQLDTKFNNFDARCYSPGMKLRTENGDVNILTANWDNIENANIIMPAKDSNGCVVWNKSDWTFFYVTEIEDSTEALPPEEADRLSDEAIERDTNATYMSYAVDTPIGGLGKCLGWRYVYEDIPTDALKPYNQTGSIKESTSTFRSEETYRFGIRLFDEHGTASSVKWIADIIMPKITETCSQKYRNVGIQFFINTYYDNWWDSWEGISAIEIVRCNRTIQDRCTLTQGIVGFPYYVAFNANSCLIPIHYMSLEQLHFQIPSYVGEASQYGLQGPQYDQTDVTKNTRWTLNKQLQEYFLSVGSLSPRRDIVMFASPEYSYLQNDVKSLLDTYGDVVSIYPSHKLDVFTEHPSYSESYIVNGETHTINHNLILQNNERDTTWMGYPYFGITKENQQPPTFITSLIYCNLNINEFTPRYNQDVSDNTATTYFRYNYIETIGAPKKYDNILTLDESNNTTNSSFVKIEDVKYAAAPSPTIRPTFSEGDNINILADSTPIADTNFINWTVTGAAMDAATMSTISLWKNNTYVRNSIFQFPVGSGGSCMLINTDKSLGIEPPNDSENDFLSVYVQNIRKPANPYRGTSGINDSIYVPHGDYCKLPDIANSSRSGIELINVFSGDTKLRAYSYNASHNFMNLFYPTQLRMGVTYAVPLECDVDIQAQDGILYGTEGYNQPHGYLIQDDPQDTLLYNQTKPAYKDTYNPIYNANLSLVTYSEKQDSKNKNSTYDTRVVYTLKKENNNIFDDWANFQTLNFLDVDSRYGEITGLKLFKNKLMFWQEHATGSLSVNERVALGDTNGNEIVLGHGSTLERFDYVTTTYGLQKNTKAYDVSENYLYWWDKNNQEILQLSEKNQLTPLGTTKHVKNYINKSSDLEIPAIIYDNKYKEVLCNIKTGGPVVYNEYIDQFTAIYKFDPVFKFLTYGQLYMASSNGPIYKYNESTENESYLFGVETYPSVEYTVNKNSQYVKTYDLQEIGGRFYGGGHMENVQDSTPVSRYGYKHERINSELSPLRFEYKTPLKQFAETSGIELSNIEYAYNLTIPRNGEQQTNLSFDKAKEWGNRMRGKTMQCKFESMSNDLDFSLQYITTKFRMSWT